MRLGNTLVAKVRLQIVLETFQLNFLESLNVDSDQSLSETVAFSLL